MRSGCHSSAATARSVGRVVDMDGQPHRIVGVMPASFEVFQANVDAWLPVQIDPASPFHTGATALGVRPIAPRRDVGAGDA